ncbi:lysostaphin resistance A-like protein [Nocardiopsis coralliicola]
MTYRWVLWAGALALAGAAVAAVGGALVFRPEAVADTRWYGVGALWGVWLPAAVGGLLTFLLGSRVGSAELDRNVAEALRGHPLVRELCVLLFLCVVGYLLGAVVIHQVISVVTSATTAAIALPASALLFLLVIPVLLVDRGGLTISGQSTRMPLVALAVREPWRWWGLAAVAASAAITAVDLPDVRPPPALLIAAVAVLLLGSAAIEEVFFRGMVQTRIELLLGPAPAVVCTALLYSFAHALVGPIDASSGIGADGFLHGTATAVLTYGVQGLLLGYIWIRYRNTWVNTLLHAVMIGGGLVPVLSTGSLPV